MPRRGRKDGPIEGESTKAENEKGWHCVRGEWKGERRVIKMKRGEGMGKTGRRKDVGKISKMTKVAKRRSRGESTPFQGSFKEPLFFLH